MVHPTRPLEVLREWSDGRDIGYVGMEVYIYIYIHKERRLSDSFRTFYYLFAKYGGRGWKGVM